MAGTWFYMRDNKRVGPVAVEQLKQMAADGRLRPEDSVWTVGMNQWTPAGQVAAVYGAVAPASSAHAPVAPPSATAQPGLDNQQIAAAIAYHAATPHPTHAHAAPVTTISYYDGGLPPRAASNLQGHAPPTGDRGEWPLDERQIGQYLQAVKIRKKISGAAQLYRGLLLLSAIALTIFVVAGLFALGTGGGGGGIPAAVMLALAGLIGGLCALYFLAARATMRSHRWAPLTMLILFSIGVGVNLLSLALGAASGSGETMVTAVLGMILPALFALVSWKAYAAIPEWRAQPAWCQEIIVKAGL